MELSAINIQDYHYNLPDERIALYPLAHRDRSKLLVYKKGAISHSEFSQLPDLLDNKSVLVFNNTKVIPARFTFKKDTGASIEVFLLQAILPSTNISATLSAIGKTTWKCAIGNVKRWSDGLILKMNLGDVTLSAKLINKEENLVEFDWQPSISTWAEILHAAGAVPLPPYIKREADASDEQRYQTVYSKTEGAVAAPTAGLHFTESTLKELAAKGIATDFLTLHVSAGTFLPVKAENAIDHIMHEEQIVISRENIDNLLVSERKIIAVGTTAMRTLESVYWYGVALLKNPDAPFVINKLQPYEHDDIQVTKEDALRAVLRYMTLRNADELTGHTSIFIFPGYRFRMCEGLITNFHQPGSTLLLLIAAFIGQDWRKVYDMALERDYRFLSYGDSSLLLPNG